MVLFRSDIYNLHLIETNEAHVQADEGGNESEGFS